MSGLSLYVIEDNLAELLLAREEVLAAIQDPAESAVPERRAELAEIDKTLAQYISLEVAKVDNYHRFFRWAGAVLEAAKKEAADMRARATRIDRAIARMKELALGAMTLASKKRVEGTAGRYLLRKGNGGQAPLVIDGWDAENECWTTAHRVLPSDYMDVTIRMPLTVWQAMASHFVESKIKINPEVVRISDPVPSNARIRARLAEACPGCDGLGIMVESKPCPTCSGNKTWPVPGARLAERGEHLEVK